MCDTLEGPFQFQRLRVVSRDTRDRRGTIYNYLNPMCGARQILSFLRVRTPSPPSRGLLGFANTGYTVYNGTAFRLLPPPPPHLGLQDVLAPPSLGHQGPTRRKADVNLLFPAAACARVWGDPCLPAVYLPDPGLDAVSLGLRRPGRAAGRQPWHFNGVEG